MIMIAQELLAVAKLLMAEDEGSPGLNGMKNREAKKFVNNLLHRHTKGFFNDDYWQPITKTFKELSRHGIEYVIEKTQYLKNDDGAPSAKIWSFTIEFYNDKSRKTTLYGTITASGAGTVADPLSRYDVVAYVS
jgi:hypothetical protein